MPSSDADPSAALVQHVRALYPLARVLAGSEKADALIEQVYQHAASVAPAERPDDERGWLFGLMIEGQGGSLHPAGAEVTPQAETSFTNDPFRREVAEQTAREALPAAFAACSLHERFILAIDALADPSDERLAAALDTTATNARSVRDRTRSALRASLRDVLTGPERMLVDVALPDDTLQDLLHTLLTDRFHPVPASLRSSVTETLEQARAERTVANASAEDTGSAPEGPSWLRVLRDALLSTRGLVGMLVGLLLLAGGAWGVGYVTSSSPPTPTSVIELAARRASGLEVTHPARTASDAAAYVRRTWNRRLRVPSIRGASLRGVGRLRLGDSTDVPVLLYTGDEGGSVVVYAFNYALLDRLGDRAVLDRDVRSRLSVSNALVPQPHAGRAVVLGRDRDDIYVVVAPGADADSLRARVQF